MSTLDQRIGTALASDTVKSADIAALVGEVEQALADAQVAAAKIKADALDPLIMLDAAKARSAVEMSSFTVERLKAALPRLETKLAEAQAAESRARWQTDYETVEAKRDGAARRFMRTRELIEQLAELFHDAAEVDREVSRINVSAPSGAPHLKTTELVARNLASFSSNDRSILAETTLHSWSGKPAWPVRRPFDVSSIMPTPQHDPRFSDDWAAHVDERRRAVEAEQRKLAEHYAAMTEAQEKRQNLEERAALQRKSE